MYLFRDQYRSPIHIRSLIEVFAGAIEKGLTGILHAGGRERQSRLETGTQLAAAYGFDQSFIHSISYRDHNHSDIMHGDGSFDISFLTQMLPGLRLRPLAEEFLTDAHQSLNNE